MTLSLIHRPRPNRCRQAEYGFPGSLHSRTDKFQPVCIPFCASPTVLRHGYQSAPTSPRAETASLRTQPGFVLTNNGAEGVILQSRFPRIELALAVALASSLPRVRLLLLLRSADGGTGVIIGVPVVAVVAGGGRVGWMGPLLCCRKYGIFPPNNREEDLVLRRFLRRSLCRSMSVEPKP